MQPLFSVMPSDQVIATSGLTKTALAFGIQSFTLTRSHTPRHLTPRTSQARRGQFSLQTNIVRCAIERPERYDATDWARALSTLPKSIVLRRIQGHIIANIVATSLVCVVYELLMHYAPDVVHHFNITPLPHTFMSTAMALLLVLRSNAAYDRFWEGRKLWGSVVNTSRTVARLCASSMPRTHLKLAGNLLVCYCYALMHHLQGRREEEPFREFMSEIYIPVELQREICIFSSESAAGLELEGQLSDSTPVNSINDLGLGRASTVYPSSVAEPEAIWYGNRTRLPSGVELVGAINLAHNKPLEVLLQLSTMIKLSLEWKLDMLTDSEPCQALICNTNVERDKLENCIIELMDVMGKCERIVKSPVPLSWNRHTSRLISLWTLTLPLVLVPIQGPISIPTIAVISWVLFSVEEIGHLVEDPFRRERYSIQLDVICECVRRDVLVQILAVKEK